MSAKQKTHAARVNALIQANPASLQEGACICGATAGDVIAHVDRYGFELDTVLCARCGTLRFDPYLSSEILSRFYELHYQDLYARAVDPAIYFDHQRDYGSRVVSWLEGRAPSSPVVFEVGCGAGGALSVLSKAGCVVHGCDLSPHLIEYGLRRKVPNLCCGDLHDLSRRTGALRADLVLLHHVFEHLPAPCHWLVSARELLAENGTVLVAVPDITRAEGYPSPDGDLRLMLHLAHKFNFTKEGLRAVAARAGMHASLADVIPSREAPELWFAFTRLSSEERTKEEPAVSVGGRLWRDLRGVERRYLRAAALRKLRRLWRAVSNRRVSRATALPTRGGSEDKEP